MAVAVEHRLDRSERHRERVDRLETVGFIVFAEDASVTLPLSSLHDAESHYCSQPESTDTCSFPPRGTGTFKSRSPNTGRLISHQASLPDILSVARRRNGSCRGHWHEAQQGYRTPSPAAILTNSVIPPTSTASGWKTSMLWPSKSLQNLYLVYSMPEFR